MATLRLEDLRRVCPKCNSAGFIQHWQWVQWWAENNDFPPQGHLLFEIPEEIPCEECDEIGYVPTEQGRVLLEFINQFRGRK